MFSLFSANTVLLKRIRYGRLIFCRVYFKGLTVLEFEFCPVDVIAPVSNMHMGVFVCLAQVVVRLRVRIFHFDNI